MPTLDIRTLLLVIALTLPVSTLALFALWRRHPTIPGLSLFPLAHGTMILGSSLIFLRGEVSDLLSVVGGNFFVAATSVLLLRGVRSLYGRRSRVLVEALWLGGVLVAFGYFLYLHPLVYARVLVMSLVLTFLSLETAWVALRASGASRSSASVFIVSAFVFVGVANGARLFFGGPIESMFGGDFLTAAAIVSSLVGPFGWTLGIVMEVNRRLYEETHAAQRLAEDSARTKSHFLAVMSHEIRTPLHAILGLNQLLLETDLDGEQRRFSTTIRSSGRVLRRILDDAVDFSQIESEDPDLEEADFDLESVLEEAGELFTETVHEKDIRLSCRIDPSTPRWVAGDAARLQQVLTNLIGNAVKFTPTEGEVEAVVRRQDQEDAGPCLRFEISDKGMGIPAEGRDRLFESFTQVDSSTTRRFGGTGLGLAISRRLVELMGGQIGVESELGRGSTFWFEIPFQPAKRPGSGEPRLSGRALLVDDWGDRRRAILEHLGAWGLRVEGVSSVAEAEYRLRSAPTVEPFDVLIVALSTAGSSHLEVEEALRRPLSLAPGLVILVAPLGDGGTTPPLPSTGRIRRLTEPLRLSLLRDELVSHLDRGEGEVPEVPDASAEDPTSPVGAAAREGRILVAEDNAVSQVVTSAILESLGYRVEVASNGREAVRLSRDGFDLILMDCEMPVMDGYQAARKIREAEAKTKADPVPILALSAGSREETRERCRAAGMDDYLAKPVDAEDLGRKAREWISPADRGVGVSGRPVGE